MDAYEFVSVVGDGMFGSVDQYRNKSNGKVVAIKRIYQISKPRRRYAQIDHYLASDDQQSFEVEDVTDTSREPFILSRLNHQNVDQEFYIVTEFLNFRLDEIENLNKRDVYQWVKQLCSGVNYLQQIKPFPVMHRDLKPANIMLDNQNNIRICDFGQAIECKTNFKYNHQVSSRWYRAPEILFGSRQYWYHVDNWAVGCIIAELLSGRVLFNGESDIHQISVVFDILGTPNDSNWKSRFECPDYDKIKFIERSPTEWKEVLPKCSNEEVLLVSALLKFEPSDRLNITDAINMMNQLKEESR